MKILYAKLNEQIYWLLRRKDPISAELNLLAPWQFVSPLLYDQMSFDRTDPASSVIPLSHDEAIVASSYLCFAIDDATATSLDQGTGSALVLSQIVRFLNLLKHISGNALTPRSPAMFSQSVDMDIEPLEIRLFAPMSFSIQKYHHDSAVTWSCVERVGALDIEYRIPVYDTLILEATQAVWSEDYRMALLYSAIAVETMAATMLDEMYELAKVGLQTPQQMHIITLPQAGNVIIKKDPIYDYLRRRTDFQVLLNELPLYVFGKSLLTENGRLYRDALKLYSTRNSIAHRGEPVGSSTSVFEANRADAVSAVECAIEVFRWYGVPANYSIPRVGFVNYENGQRVNR